MTPRSIGFIGGAALAVAASGCTVGPNFTSPAAPVVTRYTAPDEKTAPRSVVLGEKVTGEWWTLFRSPDLDRVVKQAITGNLTFESAKARFAAARESVVHVSCVPPQIDVALQRRG
jgi:outer membrane protein TolC